jgi:uncharacterized membrane protein
VSGWGTAALLAATVTNGLMAGLFAAFSYAVMPGLRRAEDGTFVEAMQRMNAAILNGWFGVCFGGAALFPAVAALLHLGGGDRALPWILAGLAAYVAVLVITFAVNVPLNNRLATADHRSAPTALAAARQGFEGAWVRWNVVRAVLSTVAFGGVTWALVVSAGM